MTAAMKKLQCLWALVARHGASHASIRELVTHAQDMEAARIQSLLDDMLKEPAGYARSTATSSSAACVTF